FKGAGSSIPPKGEVDLDAVLGRGRAEGSNQVLVAFEEGYLQTVRKDDGAAVPEAAGGAAVVTSAGLERALGDLRASLAGDMRTMIESLKVARARLREEKERLLVDDSLSDAEIKARLACLDEEERELEKNFSEIGRKT